MSSILTPQQMASSADRRLGEILAAYPLFREEFAPPGQGGAMTTLFSRFIYTPASLAQVLADVIALRDRYQETVVDTNRGTMISLEDRNKTLLPHKNKAIREFDSFLAENREFNTEKLKLLAGLENIERKAVEHHSQSSHESKVLREWLRASRHLDVLLRQPDFSPEKLTAYVQSVLDRDDKAATYALAEELPSYLRIYKPELEKPIADMVAADYERHSHQIMRGVRDTRKLISQFSNSLKQYIAASKAEIEALTIV